jgi:hypothetical protein
VFFGRIFHVRSAELFAACGPLGHHGGSVKTSLLQHFIVSIVGAGLGSLKIQEVGG